MLPPVAALYSSPSRHTGFHEEPAIDTTVNPTRGPVDVTAARRCRTAARRARRRRFGPRNMTFHQGPRIALVAAVAACAVMGAGAHAADDPPRWPYVPPAEQGEPIVSSRLTPDHQYVEMIDLATNKVLMHPTAQVELWDTF